ncbi:hypothetical protein LL912_07005 [Niabella sp. CC-SYL272]|uniref:hypothetical protein n=1 Tax=Niabella agricola TaxID=2891571 RepID=UPI001F23003A|nr:hypothetical protein [Niabella agricola]MCF3108521.1 hypothetical protein [Niabella agricola]
MKKYAKPFLIVLFVTGLTMAGQSQTAKDISGQKPAPETPGNTDSTGGGKELEASLAKAAAAAERAAGKIRSIIENKADKLAKSSQPYVDSLASSTANLIEKLARELDQMVDANPPQKRK